VLDGEITPTTEICGSGLDEDCDGLIDEIEGDVTPQAFVMVIDFSGSMADVIDATIEALCSWSVSGRFTDSVFAIVAVGTGGGEPPYVTRITDFVSASGACYALTNYLTENGLVGGVEFIPYAVWGLHNDPSFDVSWPDDMTKRVIFFTDEDPQGYLQTASSNMHDVAEDCVENDYSVSGFVFGSHYQWRPMTTPCDGWIEQMSYDYEDMREALDQRFGSEC
jgi:hypothetical protein